MRIKKLIIWLQVFIWLPVSAHAAWEQLGPGNGGQIYAMEFMNINSTDYGFIGSDVAPMWIGTYNTSSSIWEWEPADFGQLNFSEGQDFEAHPQDSTQVFVALDKGIYTYDLDATGTPYALYGTTPSHGSPSSDVEAPSTISAAVQDVAEPGTDKLHVFIGHGDIWQGRDNGGSEGDGRKGSAGGIYRRTDTGSWEFIEIPDMNDEAEDGSTTTSTCEGSAPSGTNACPAIFKISADTSGYIMVATENGVYIAPNAFDATVSNIENAWVRLDQDVDSGDGYTIAGDSPPEVAKSLSVAWGSSNAFGDDTLVIFPETDGSGGMYTINYDSGSSTFTWDQITTDDKLTSGGGNDYPWQAMVEDGDDVYMINNGSDASGTTHGGTYKVWKVTCDSTCRSDRSSNSGSLTYVTYTSMHGGVNANLGWAFNYPAANPNSFNMDHNDELYAAKSGVYFRWNTSSSEWDYEYTDKHGTDDTWRHRGMVNTVERDVAVIDGKVFYGSADRGFFSQDAPGDDADYVTVEDVQLNPNTTNRPVTSGGFAVGDGSDIYIGGSRGYGSNQKESGIFIWDSTNSEWDLIGGGLDSSNDPDDLNGYTTGDKDGATSCSGKRSVNAPFGADFDAEGTLFVVSKGNDGGIWTYDTADTPDWTLWKANDFYSACTVNFFPVSIDFYEDTNNAVEWMAVAVRKNGGTTGGVWMNYREKTGGSWDSWDESNGQFISGIDDKNTWKVQFDSAGNLYASQTDNGIWLGAYSGGTPSYSNFDWDADSGTAGTNPLTSLESGQQALAFAVDDNDDIYVAFYSAEDADDSEVRQYDSSAETWSDLTDQPPITKSLGVMYFDGGANDDLYLGTSGMGIWVNTAP